MNLLKEAYKIKTKARQQAYGDAVTNFKRTAKIASMITGKELSASDCVKVMMAVKLSREASKHKRDNMLDLCGYAAILEDLGNE